MEGQRWIGIDVGKRTMEARIIEADSKVKGWQGRTDYRGRAKLASLIHAGDKVGIEAGVLGFSMAKELRQAGADVFVLNPGKLAVIYASTKKTDAEDALKLARLVQRFEPDELPIVCAPSADEEKDRELVSELAFLKQARTRFINHLHAIYLRAGQTQVTKRQIADTQSRGQTRSILEGSHCQEAIRCERMIDLLEEQIAEIEIQQTERLRKNDLTPYLVSIPGVGPALAMSFEAYIGDGRRFSSGAQVANYTGLVPRIDCSGETNHYGSITKRGCVAIRRVAIQAAWAMVQSRNGGSFKEFYQRRSSDIGKKKAIVAVARKMVVLMYSIAKNREYYRSTTEKERLKKLRIYKLCVNGAGG
jgi:transposase